MCSFYFCFDFIDTGFFFLIFIGSLDGSALAFIFQTILDIISITLLAGNKPSNTLKLYFLLTKM